MCKMNSILWLFHKFHFQQSRLITSPKELLSYSPWILSWAVLRTSYLSQFFLTFFLLLFLPVCIDLGTWRLLARAGFPDPILLSSSVWKRRTIQRPLT